MWLAPSGREMTEPEWNAGHVKYIGVRLAGDAIDEVDEDGTPIVGSTLLYLMNASNARVPFTLSAFVVEPRWQTLLDTFDDRRAGEIHPGAAVYPLEAHSLAVFELRQSGENSS
jgi:glycogen operon protein